MSARLRRLVGLLGNPRAAPILLLVLFLALFSRQLFLGKTVVPYDMLGDDEPWNVYVPGIPGNDIIGDAMNQHFEWVTDFHRRTRSGDLPQWQPLIVGGVPYAPNGSVAVHYPPSWLHTLFHPELSYTLFMVLHFWLAAVGMWMLCRALRLSNFAALFAGVTFAISGLVRDWSFGPLNVPALTLAPWLLWSVEKAISSPSMRSAGLIAICGGAMLLGGNLQFVVYAFIAAALYGFVRLLASQGPTRRIAAVIAASAGVLLALGIGAAELLPVLGITSLISRSGETLSSLVGTLAPPGHLVRYAIPDFFADPLRHQAVGENADLWMNSPYVGLLAAAAALAACVRFWDRRIFPLIAVAVMGMAFAYVPQVHSLMYRLSEHWGAFRAPARWLSVTNLAVAALAGIGVDALARTARARRWHLSSVWIALAGLLSLPLGYSVFISRPPLDFLRPELVVLAITVVAAIVALVLAAKFGAAWILVALVPELVLYFVPYFPALSRDADEPYLNIPEMTALAELPPGRIARVGARVENDPVLTHNVPMLIQRPDADGFTVLMPRRYAAFRNLIQGNGDWAKNYNEIPNLVPAASLTSPLFDLAGIRYLIAESDVPGPHGWIPVSASKGAIVYENPRAPLPFAWTVPRRESLGLAQLEATMGSETFDPYEVALVSKPVPNAGDVEPAPTAVLREYSPEGLARRRPVRVLNDDPDNLILDLSGSTGSEVVISMGFHPGWRASIDGVPARVEPVDMAFTGVPLSAGARRLELWFDWKHLRYGRYASGTALAAVLVLFLISAWRRKAGTEPA